MTDAMVGVRRGGMAAPEDATGRKNMMLLIQLRWIAIAGQFATIAVAELYFRIELPMGPIALVLLSLFVLNLASLLRLRHAVDVRNSELLLVVILDVLGLTAQIYLSGGAANPFIFLYLLQVTLAVVLLEAWSAWMVVLVAGFGFALLTMFSWPLLLPPNAAQDLFRLHIFGMFVCFLLDAALLVVFTSRISRNLRARDAHLADMRQRAAEEDHIVRMGLLATGAAHELGTPLASLSVILNDWRHMQPFGDDSELRQDLDVMESEIARCKAIVTGILLAAGDPRGESPVQTTMRGFLGDVAREWGGIRPTVTFTYEDQFGPDIPIVSDAALKQVLFNVLDNAAEASPKWVSLTVRREADMLVLAVTDAGPGFSEAMLANLGKPYQSNKGREGRGLGLFLVVNVLRKLGGAVAARNRSGNGAVVTMTLPLSALSLRSRDAHAF